MSIKNPIMKLAEPIVKPITKLILLKHYDRNKKISALESSQDVVILAPHMDDETIGLGGTIYNYQKQSTKVHCIFITDGASSNGKADRDQVSVLRKKEIDQVKGLLGISEVYYVDVPDGKVTGNQQAEQVIRELIKQINPKVIYTSSNVDAHPDHVGTAQLLASVLAKDESLAPLIRQYEINCPMPPDEINYVVDITEAFPIKKKATSVFKSQVIAFDGFLLLSEVKSNLVNNRSIKHVEGFIELPRKEFIARTSRLKEKNHPYPQLFKQANRSVTLLWAIFKNYKMKKRIYRESKK